MNHRIEAIENPEIDPICPHCEKEIRRLLMRKIETILGVRYLYYCAGCRKVLGISHRKGFWMG